MNTTIIEQVKSAFEDTKETLLKDAEKTKTTLEASLHNANTDDHDFFVQQAIDYIEGLKDTQILDDVQLDVLSGFTDNDICELDEYDETSGIRTDFQQVINDELDDVIEQVHLYKTIYAVYDVEDNQFVEHFDDKESAIEASKKYDGHEVRKVQLISMDFDESSDNELNKDPNYDASIDVRIDGEVETAEFYIQLCDGYFLSQMGCWLTASDGGDGVFNEVEGIINGCFDIATLAGKYARQALKKRFKYHNTGFNCSINSMSAYIREDTVDEEFEIIIINDGFNSNDYNTEVDTVYGIYDTLDEAQAFCNEYKTGEYNDFTGLSNLFEVIASDHV